MAVFKLACGRCGSDKIDLFRMKDEIWWSAGLALSDIVCLDCTEKALARQLSLPDLDPIFPWWGIERPKYYTGIVDGVRGKSTTDLAADSEYQIGVELGKRFATHSTIEDITIFLNIANLKET